MQVQKFSSKEVEKAMTHVKRFDSAEFIKVLTSFPRHGYIVYAANGYGCVQRAKKAVMALHPHFRFADRAISKTERVIIRIPQKR
jgi:hypothetical protein